MEDHRQYDLRSKKNQDNSRKNNSDTAIKKTSENILKITADNTNTMAKKNDPIKEKIADQVVTQTILVPLLRSPEKLC